MPSERYAPTRLDLDVSRFTNVYDDRDTRLHYEGGLDIFGASYHLTLIAVRTYVDPDTEEESTAAVDGDDAADLMDLGILDGKGHGAFERLRVPGYDHEYVAIVLPYQD
jgi:hypothetical protein